MKEKPREPESRDGRLVSRDAKLLELLKTCYFPCRATTLENIKFLYGVLKGLENLDYIYKHREKCFKCAFRRSEVKPKNIRVHAVMKPKTLDVKVIRYFGI